MNIFREEYDRKKRTAQELVSLFESGWTCTSDIALAIPCGIYDALEQRVRCGDITDITIHTMLELSPLGCYTPELSKKLKGISWFSGAYARKAVASGYGDIMPCYYHDMPELFERYIEIDAFCAVVSPMDKDGYFCAFNGSNSSAMLKKAKHIFLEVNKNMPRVPGSSIIHVSQVSALCENNVPLTVLHEKEPDDISTVIGNLIADEIPNGATIQLGIGAIPEAVGRALVDKHNLGIHTEMFTDSMVELLKCGAADNSTKPINTGRSVAAFALGSEKMYRFMDNNPSIQMLPVNYTNDPRIISKHPDMMSVNAALEVDFIGQVCAESIGRRHYSGTGGQVDFVRGAVASKGGKSFIAFPSTTRDGKISKIKPTLSCGAIVTTGKNDVDHIVTEYGIAKLRGRTFSQRAKDLIAIAHPKFRDKLLYDAKQQHIIV